MCPQASTTSASSSCDCGSKSGCRRQFSDVCVSPSTTITPSNIESPESPKPEAHTEHDENASTQPLSPEPEDMDMARGMIYKCIE
jgi:hypothetical protein